jgi:L-threonylcarbamoyladenylate synthase
MINTITIHQIDPGCFEKAAELIRAGEVIAVPTDTVYGIACSVSHPQAIRRLYEIKGRDARKAIPVLVGNLAQLDLVTANFNEKARILADRFWPGALTIIVEKKPSLPTELTSFPTVGVRMPNHVWLLELNRQCGPLAATSANLSGKPDPANAIEVAAQLGGRIPMIVDGGECRGGIASTVVDCTQPEIKILREGGISSRLIFEALSGQDPPDSRLRR